ncbi:hypothetical protein QE152_g19439 [Popillia japonica]|uniref:DUF4371 domain-containing protein n=1 Tax=Popillia japonica TaxID=7064 RepID=A0AAW1KRE9_POPJA
MRLFGKIDRKLLFLSGIGISCQGPKEELLGLVPLSGQTRGEGITNAVQKCLEDNKIDLNKIVSIATDGASTMIGKNKGEQRFFKPN